MPFETYLDCNEAMKTATIEDEATACYTTELKQEIIDKRFGDLEPWLERRASGRMEEPRLFRATVVEDGMARDRKVRLEDGETVQLLMYEPRGSAFWRFIVEMTRSTGAWKISREESHTVGGGFGNDDPPPSVSLSYSGGVEWASDDDVYFGNFGTRGCRLQIAHVFETYASVQTQLDCALLAEPGTYGVDDIERAGGPVRIVAPELGGLDEAHEGVLEVTHNVDGRISGSFRFRAVHEGIVTNETVDYEVSGSFENVPFVPEME